MTDDRAAVRELVDLAQVDARRAAGDLTLLRRRQEQLLRQAVARLDAGHRVVRTPVRHLRAF